MNRFEGKVALITGSSNGIGRATAVLMSREGAKVVITGRNEKSLQESKAECEAVGAKAILVLQGDIIDSAFQKTLVDETVKAFGGIDILVNNAGGCAPDLGGLAFGFEQPIENFDYVVALNAKSGLQMALLAMPYLEKAQGEIVFVSSIAACDRAATGLAYYAASKAACDQFMRSLAIVSIKKGVRVNAVSPGVISTAIQEKQGASKEQVQQIEKMWSSDFGMLPIGRMGRSDEVAALIAFLADRKTCGFIVGQTLIIDGGSSIMCPLFSIHPGVE